MQLETEIRSNPEHIFYKVTGSLTFQQLIEVAYKIDVISKEKNIINVVADYREAVFDINMASLFEIPEQLETAGMPIETKSAVLYIKGTEFSEKIETYLFLARSRGHIIELFTDENKALVWLRKKSL